jgi:hypothetical protein
MPATSRLGCLLVLLAALGACGGRAPPPEQPPARQPTVFDDLVNKKKELPAAVELAQQQHVEETRRAIEAADAPPADESKR